MVVSFLRVQVDNMEARFGVFDVQQRSCASARPMPRCALASQPPKATKARAWPRSGASGSFDWTVGIGTLNAGRCLLRRGVSTIDHGARRIQALPSLTIDRVTHFNPLLSFVGVAHHLMGWLDLIVGGWFIEDVSSNNVRLVRRCRERSCVAQTMS